MRGLRDFKVPDFKFPKFKMRDISEIEEMNMSNEEIEKQKEERKKERFEACFEYLEKMPLEELKKSYCP